MNTKPRRTHPYHIDDCPITCTFPTSTAFGAIYVSLANWGPLSGEAPKEMTLLCGQTVIISKTLI